MSFDILREHRLAYDLLLCEKTGTLIVINAAPSLKTVSPSKYRSFNLVLLHFTYLYFPGN